MATPQQIAAAYQDTVGKGLMSQAEFISRAQSEFQVTPAQLVAAQAILVGAGSPVVQANLESMPQQQVVNYLRETTPAQNQITPTQDPNALGGMITEGRGAGGELFRPIYTGGAGEGETPQLAGYTQYLAEFDPTYEGGEYGSYIGVYDTQGNLTDVKFQKGERNAGALQEFATRYGYLVPLGAAAAGAAGLLPDFTGAGASALDPFGGGTVVWQRSWGGWCANLSQYRHFDRCCWKRLGCGRCDWSNRWPAACY